MDEDGTAWRAGDVLLEPVSLPPGGRTLAAALIADPAARADAVERLLDSVALAEEGAAPERASGAVTVASDGRYAFGPTAGWYRKPRAEYIGAAARERSRAERLAALDERIGAHGRALANADERLSGLERDGERLAAELRAFPSDAELRAAERHRTDSEHRERDARGALEEAQALCERARAEHAAAGEEADSHRNRNRLPDDLDLLGESLRAYSGALERLELEATAVAGLGERAHEDGALAERARGEAEAAAGARGEAEGRARELEAALEAARAKVGASARKVLAEIEAGERRRGELKGERNAIVGRVEELAGARGSLESEHASAAEAAQAAAAGRDAAAEALTALERGDLLRLALGEDAEGVDDGDTVERAGRLAAHVLKAVPAGGVTHSTLVARVDDGYAELRSALNSHPRIALFMEGRAADGLPLVGARVDAEERTFVQLAAWLDGQLAEQRELLSDKERAVFEDALAGDIAEHLYERIHGAHRWVEEAQRKTASCRASSGMGVRLAFGENEDEHPGVKRALALLRRSPATLAEGERDELVGFLRERISAAREAGEADGAEALLVRALDYRDWHRFKLEIVLPDGTRRPFTRHRRDQGSGGEREVLLHLPLLAAAAALYDSGHADAPRLIALDEAFTKVDAAGERGLLATTVELDLDLLLTGHDLWCTHPEVPAVEIYHLKRYDGHFGVVPLYHWRWNGRAREAVGEPD